jgi:hypothetical protein
MLRERDFLRKVIERKRLQKLSEAGKIQAEKQLKGSVFRVMRMLAVHRIIESIIGGKK